MKKIMFLMVFVLLVSLVSAKELIDYEQKDGITWATYELGFWDNLFHFPEQSVYEIKALKPSITLKDSQTIEIYYNSKYVDAEANQIELFFYDAKNQKYINSFKLIKGGALTKGTNYKTIIVIDSSVINQYLNGYCNKYVAIVGNLWLKIPQAKTSLVPSISSLKGYTEGSYYWYRECYNVECTHILQQFIISCPETLKCSPGEYEKRCQGKDIYQRIIASDCTEKWVLYKPCGYQCSNAQCVAGCDKIGQISNEYCIDYILIQRYWDDNCVIQQKTISNSIKCGYKTEDPPDESPEIPGELIIDEVTENRITGFYIKDNNCVSTSILESQKSLYYSSEDECQKALEFGETIPPEEKEEVTEKENFITKNAPLLILALFGLIIIGILIGRRR